WSTVKASTCPCLAFAHRTARKRRARLSAPPDTAQARSGSGSKGPSAAIKCAKFAAPRGWSPSPSAAESLPLAPGTLENLTRRIPIATLQFSQGAASIVATIEHGERHAEFQQIVGRLARFRILLEAFGEDSGGGNIVASHVVGLTQPVLRVARQRMLGVRLQEGLQCCFRLFPARLPQKAEGLVILCRCIATWQSRLLP